MSVVKHIGLLERATQEFVTRLDQVQPRLWTAPTPCDQWDVHFLVAEQDADA